MVEKACMARSTIRSILAASKSRAGPRNPEQGTGGGGDPEIDRPSCYSDRGRTGSDTHSVGILDAGYAGNLGLEAYQGFSVLNLGSQVPNEVLIREAVRISADTILVSQTRRPCGYALDQTIAPKSGVALKSAVTVKIGNSGNTYAAFRLLSRRCRK